MRTIKYFIAMTVLLAGCVGQHISHNYVMPNLPSATLEAIATDIVPMITKGNPAKEPGFLIPRDNFGQLLGNKLAQKGYKIIAAGQNVRPTGKIIRYTIDQTSPGQLYIALAINNSQRYIRSYNNNRGSLIPQKTKIMGANDE